MRVMVDTNVIISAILKEESISDVVLTDVCENHELIICDYIILECYTVAKRRFPQQIQVFAKSGEIAHLNRSKPHSGERENAGQRYYTSSVRHGSGCA